MVASTNGFFARDYNLELGWNNMRYIIEAAFLQATLLGRVLILPSFVYARSCEYENRVCADYATMVNRGDAVDNDEWRELPIDQQMGWKIPIELMINITHLRHAHPVLTTADYLRLHGQDPSSEASNGHWTRDLYHSRPNLITGRFPSLKVIPNSAYDPEDVVRVDRILDDDTAERNFSVADPQVVQTLYAALPAGKSILEWQQAQSALGIWGDLELDRVVTENGWRILYTYDSVAGLDYNKAAVNPIKMVAPRSALRGFETDYRHIRTNVLLLEGAVHYGRKLGGLYFTTRLAQDLFSSNVLYDFQRVDILQDIAAKMVEHMFDLTDGRLWMAAHVRRGDFVRYHWTMEATPESHIERVKRHLEDGRNTLIRLSSHALKVYDVPGDVRPDIDLHNRTPPASEGIFYLATDEQDPDVLEMFRREGAILMDDLLTIEDRRHFASTRHEHAWALMISDVRAVVEQIVLSKAAFFYGHAMSSVPGGVINLRAARGADPRTAVID
ncbi:hypothetical protein BDZ89DRAFT_954732 [Hymenopellis radicata]|nr:hypothetical protein BDZ89DRAFT_954732 [Hymenopellis radicata]